MSALCINLIVKVDHIISIFVDLADFQHFLIHSVKLRIAVEWSINIRIIRLCNLHAPGQKSLITRGNISGKQISCVSIQFLRRHQITSLGDGNILYLLLFGEFTVWIHVNIELTAIFCIIRRRSFIFNIERILQFISSVDIRINIVNIAAFFCLTAHCRIRQTYLGTVQIELKKLRIIRYISLCIKVQIFILHCLCHELI